MVSPLVQPVRATHSSWSVIVKDATTISDLGEVLSAGFFQKGIFFFLFSSLERLG